MHSPCLFYANEEINAGHEPKFLIVIVEIVKESKNTFQQKIQSNITEVTNKEDM